MDAEVRSTVARRYTALTQSPYCCVPTVILMVLLRRELPLMQVSDIGVELGLAVPDDVGSLYPGARRGVRPSSGYGTEIQTSQYALNSFFERNGYKIRETYFPTSPESDAGSWIKGLLECDSDVIVCFNDQALFGGDWNWGHVCLVDSISGDVITLIDPSYQRPKFREVSVKQLQAAIALHGESNRGGFWVVRA